MRNGYLDFLTPAGANPKQAACSLCVVDISGSMEMPDYPPTRLKAAIVAIEAMLWEKIRLRSHDKMGIVGFSHKGIRICPLTKVSDSRRILRSLKNLQTLGSTNFVEGLGLAQEMFEEEAGIRQRKPGFLQLLLRESKSQIAKRRITGYVPHVIFLSDGEHT